MHCGIRERAITQNVVLWLFSNNHNALWHLKVCHDAKVVVAVKVKDKKRSMSRKNDYNVLWH
jgi:hypothetical protein